MAVGVEASTASRKAPATTARYIHAGPDAIGEPTLTRL
jgi:hypothetical protein